MKFGFRTPSLKRRISARTSLKRALRHRMGLKAPRGVGVLTNPKKAIYNKIYNKTTFGIGDLSKKSFDKKTEALHGKELNIKQQKDKSIDCPRCGKNMGKPKKLGWFFRAEGYKCSNCGLKAKITHTQRINSELDVGVIKG